MGRDNAWGKRQSPTSTPSLDSIQQQQEKSARQEPKKIIRDTWGARAGAPPRQHPGDTRRHRSDPGPVGKFQQPTGLERNSSDGRYRGQASGGWGQQPQRQPLFEEIQARDAQRSRMVAQPTRGTWAARAGVGARSQAPGPRNHQPKATGGQAPPRRERDAADPRPTNRVHAQPTRAPEPEQDAGWVDDNGGWNSVPTRGAHNTQQSRVSPQSNQRKQPPMPSKANGRRNRSNNIVNSTRNQNNNKSQSGANSPAEKTFSKEFTNWFVKQLNQILPNRPMDDEVFLSVLGAMEGHECKDFITAQLGHSGKVTKFAEQFVEQKDFDLCNKQVKHRGTNKKTSTMQQNVQSKPRKKNRGRGGKRGRS